MSHHNLIAQENAASGTPDWQLTRVWVDGQGSRTPAIEGYCSHQSVTAGERVQVMVSTNPASPFELEIFRLGYYQGTGARLMAKLGPFQGQPQPDPVVGPQRLRECQWPAALEFIIPPEWVSGVYLGRLTTLPEHEQIPYWQSYVIFIVRDDRKADIVFQCSDNTWQAYNRWPDQWSLYTDPRGSHAMNVSVSFNRPYGQYCQIFNAAQSVGSGEFLLWEFPLAFWLEEHGYDVTYCSNSDVMESGQLTRGKVFLSVGHDEYWDLRQYNTVKNAIEQGVHVLWLSGNTAHVVSPLTASGTGQEKRTLTRSGLFGGVTAEELNIHPTAYPDPPLRGPDESLLIGARTLEPFTGGGDWICTMPDHWIFEGTGMQHGDRIPGLVGWEYHGAPAALPGLEVVAKGHAWRNGTDLGHWTATIFEAPQGNIVFNAATIFWPQGLSSPPGHILPWSHGSRPHGVDRRVQQITRNLLTRASCWPCT